MSMRCASWLRVGNHTIAPVTLAERRESRTLRRYSSSRAV